MPSQIESSALMLLLEGVLEKLLKDQGIVPARWETVCAHRVDKQPSNNPNFVSIVADLPDWTQFDGEGAVIAATFQPAADVSNPDKRTDNAVVIQTFIGNLLDMFSRDNYDATKQSLNGAIAGIGFDGWEQLVDDSQDGRSLDEKKFAPQIKFVFDVFLYAF